MTKRILHLTLERKWFDLIASGEKKIEWRDVKPYWTKRLQRKYDVIQFRNGYRRDSPLMQVEYKGIIEKHIHMIPPAYALSLGKILWIKNYDGLSV